VGKSLPPIDHNVVLLDISGVVLINILFVPNDPNHGNKFIVEFLLKHDFRLMFSIFF
jgi:hypothetical protein